MDRISAPLGILMSRCPQAGPVGHGWAAVHLVYPGERGHEDTSGLEMSADDWPGRSTMAAILLARRWRRKTCHGPCTVDRARRATMYVPRSNGAIAVRLDKAGRHAQTPRYPMKNEAEMDSARVKDMAALLATIY
jgi:hypothetical protein